MMGVDLCVGPLIVTDCIFVKLRIDLINNEYKGAYYGEGSSITFWLVTDLSQIGGWEVAKSLVEFSLESKDSRIAIINCGQAAKIDDAIQSKKHSS